MVNIIQLYILTRLSSQQDFDEQISFHVYCLQQGIYCLLNALNVNVNVNLSAYQDLIDTLLQNQVIYLGE